MDWAAWTAHGEAVITLIVGAVIGWIINWVFFRKAEKPKRLAYELRSMSRMVSATGEERQRLQVIYNDAEVENPNLTIVRLGNIGKQDIIRDDFRGHPIQIDFGNSVILSATCSDRQNPEISIEFASIPGRNAVGVTPDLLKPAEWFDLKVVTDGRLIEPRMTARIVGDKLGLKRGDLDFIARRKRRTLATISGLGVFFAGAGVGAYELVSSNSSFRGNPFFFLAIFAISLVLALAMFWAVYIANEKEDWVSRWIKEHEGRPLARVLRLLREE
jgi:hypothetical protein